MIGAGCLRCVPLPLTNDNGLAWPGPGNRRTVGPGRCRREPKVTSASGWLDTKCQLGKAQIATSAQYCRSAVEAKFLFIKSEILNGTAMPSTHHDINFECREKRLCLSYSI